MNDDSFENLWSQLAERRQQTRCPLSDDEVDFCIRNASKSEPQAKRAHLVWRSVAAVAALVLTATGIGFALLRTNGPAQPKGNDPSQMRHYAYTENAAGIRVYCENGCSADDVLRQMQETIRALN